MYITHSLADSELKPLPFLVHNRVDTYQIFFKYSEQAFAFCDSAVCTISSVMHHSRNSPHQRGVKMVMQTYL